MTESVARRYFDAWTSRDRETVAELVEHLTVRDGRLVSSTFVADMATFAAFAAP